MNPIYKRERLNHVTFWKIICKEKGKKIPEHQLESLWARSHNKHATINTEVLEMVKVLKKHYIVGCISNTQEPHVTFNRKRGIFEQFSPCYLSNEIGLRKSDQRIFLKYLDDVSCKPEEALFIDDEEKNLRAPKKLGIQTILFKNNKQLQKELQKKDIIL